VTSRLNDAARPRLVVVGVVLAGLVLVACAVVVLAARRSPAIEVGRVVDEAGWVNTVDAEQRMFSFSTSVFGFPAKRIAVSRETQILVGDREGAFGDILEGKRLAVAYRVLAAGLVAEWIGIDTRRPRQASQTSAPATIPEERTQGPSGETESRARDLRPAPESEGAVADRVDAPSREPPAAVPNPIRSATPPAPGVAEVQSTQAREPSASRVPRASHRRPVRRAESQKGSPPVSAPSPPPAPSLSPALATRPGEAARPDEPSPDAAIDWLFRETGRH
jgi:hypothetical protein